MKRMAMLATLALALQLAATAANLSPQDQKFVREAAQGGMTEVLLGQIASKKAFDDSVRQFAQLVVKDHTKAGKQLKDVATEKGVRLPTEVAFEQKALFARLEPLEDAEFDRAYIMEMVKNHELDVKEFQKEADAGRDPDVKSWATKMLPLLQAHLKMAKEAAAKVVK
jgi:putative membrane protein